MWGGNQRRKCPTYSLICPAMSLCPISHCLSQIIQPLPHFDNHLLWPRKEDPNFSIMFVLFSHRSGSPLHVQYAKESQAICQYAKAHFIATAVQSGFETTTAAEVQCEKQTEELSLRTELNNTFVFMRAIDWWRHPQETHPSPCSPLCLYWHPIATCLTFQRH